MARLRFQFSRIPAVLLTVKKKILVFTATPTLYSIETFVLFCSTPKRNENRERESFHFSIFLFLCQRQRGKKVQQLFFPLICFTSHRREIPLHIKKQRAVWNSNLFLFWKKGVFLRERRGKLKWADDGFSGVQPSHFGVYLYNIFTSMADFTKF